MTKIRSVRKGTLDGGNGAEALRGDGKVVMMDSVPKLETGIWGVIVGSKCQKVSYRGVRAIWNHLINVKNVWYQRIYLH